MIRGLFLLLFFVQLFFSLAEAKTDPNSDAVDSIIVEGTRLFSMNPAKSMELFRQSLELAREDKYENGIARSYHLIAQLLLKQGNQDSAMYLLDESIKIYDSIADSLNIGKVLITRGDIFLQIGDYEKSLDSYTNARRVLESHSEYQTMLTVLQRIGDFMWKTEEYTQSAEYFNEALLLAKSKSDTSHIVRVYLSLGNLNSKIKDFTKARSYFDSSVLYPKYVSLRQKSAIYSSLGIVNYSTGNYKDSYDYHLKSQEVKKMLGDSVGLAGTWLNLGNTLSQLNRKDEAQKVLLQSLETARRLNLHYIIRTAYLNLSRICEEQKDYQKALYFDNLYDSIDRKLFNEEKTRQLTEIREVYQAEKKDAEILLLQKNEEIQEKESTSRLQQRNFLIGTTILLIVIISLVYRAYRQKRQTNLILAEQNILIARREKEKELLLHEVNHRVKNNLQMVAGLLRLQSYNLKDDKAAEAVKEGQARIESLTLIHKKIFEKGDHKKILVSEYFHELVDNLLLSNGREVNLEFDFEPLELDIDQVIPLALIVNELVTNSIKYAYSDQEDCTLGLSMSTSNSGEAKLLVWDNGHQPIEMDELKETKSFGINLVFTLTKQLAGEIIVLKEAGTRWQLKFPLK